MKRIQDDHEQTQQRLSGIIKKKQIFHFYWPNISLESMRRSATDSFLQENPSHYTYPDSQIQTNHLQKQPDVLRFIKKIESILILIHFS